jgi:hypothetical protein
MGESAQEAAIPPARTAASGEEDAIAAAQHIAAQTAQWKANMKWPAILAEGVILAIIGAVMWLAPGVGVRTLVDLVGLVMIVTALRNDPAAARNGYTSALPSGSNSVGSLHSKATV